MDTGAAGPANAAAAGDGSYAFIYVDELDTLSAMPCPFLSPGKESTGFLWRRSEGGWPP
jgi:hypothetical protein